MELKNIEKIYEENKPNEVTALKNISAKFEKGKFYAIMGRSGAGKTTLINILGLMDYPTKGKYILNGRSIENLNSKELAKIRNENIGFVFQSYYLDNLLTAKENVILPSLINKKYDKMSRQKRAIDLLKKLDIEERQNHYPNQLSGGESQRVAIARALMNDPDKIIADEPTGNLDTKNEIRIFELLKKISKEGKRVIVVSHNELIKKYADEVLYLEDGELDCHEK